MAAVYERDRMQCLLGSQIQTKGQKRNKPGSWRWEWRRDNESMAFFDFLEIGQRDEN